MMQSIRKIFGRGRSNSQPTIGDTSVSSSAFIVSSNPNTSSLHQAPPLSIEHRGTSSQRVPPSAPKKPRHFKHVKHVNLNYPSNVVPNELSPHERTRIVEEISRNWFALYSDTSKLSTRVTFGRADTIHLVCPLKIPGWYQELMALVDHNYEEMGFITSRAKKMRNKVLNTMAGYGMNDESLPTALEAMFKDCYTREDLEAFKLACEAQCDEWTSKFDVYDCAIYSLVFHFSPVTFISHLFSTVQCRGSPERVYERSCSLRTHRTRTIGSI